jgi:hypothetical protein
MKKKKSETKGSLLPSALADVELQHIERALAQLRTMKHQPSGTLNVDYWRQRLCARACSKAAGRSAAHRARFRRQRAARTGQTRKNNQ